MHLARSQKGSAAVEAVVSLTSIVTIVSLGFLVVYSSFAHVWLDRSAYEALVCLSTRATMPECESKLRAETARGLPIGKLTDVRLDRTTSRASIELKFRFHDRVIARLKQSLRLPLRSGVLK